MPANIPLAVRHVIEEYRSFLRTSYRFLDPHLREQFETHLASADVVVHGPYVTLSRDFANGATLAALVEAGRAAPDLLRMNWAFGTRPLYRHQERAFEVGRAGRPFVLTTGTGSGKTEAFLLPVLDGVLRRRREGAPGVQAILLYPMNALANDQLERLRRLLRGTKLDVSFALYTGDSDAATANLKEEPAETERLTRTQIRSNPPDLLLTNYKQLEFLLVRRQDRALFTSALRWLVLDELHSYRGALATEIACLIRRLKAHAGVRPGDLVALGTSATVGSAGGGASGLAEFASDLFGDPVSPEDIVGEELVPARQPTHPWTPKPPALNVEELSKLNPEDAAHVVALAERLTGRKCPPAGSRARRIGAVLEDNAVVATLEQALALPAPLAAAVSAVRARFPDRAAVPEDVVLREVEAYLLAGSACDGEDDPPRLRPKLHTFFHGVYDVSLCLNPTCRKLVPHGGTECPACGSAARPAALCRTCGQDFVKVRSTGGDGQTVGSGDFFSDEKTIFLTPEIHALPEAGDEEEEGAGEEDDPRPKPKRMGSRKKASGVSRMDDVSLCVACGQFVEEGGNCRTCGRPGAPYLKHAGDLHSCPACGDIYTQGDIVTPLRTGTASTAAVLAERHLDHLSGDDRRLLLFTDNRQDAAHQAGYTTDRHRTFVLRHLIAREVLAAGERGVYLNDDLPQRLFDQYQKLGLIPKKTTRQEREKWLEVLQFLAANEVTRHARQRTALENLGMIAVEYEFIEELDQERAFQAAATAAGLKLPDAMILVRAILDVLRKSRAVAYPFFQEYVDPAKKRKYREMEADPYRVRFPDRDYGPKGFALDRPDHIRKARSGTILGFIQENHKAGQLTAVHKIAKRVIGDRDRAEAFVRALVPLLGDQGPDAPGILVEAENFPIPSAEKVRSLHILQIAPRVIRLKKAESGFRCNACRAWRPYMMAACPTPRCRDGQLTPAEVDRENYYVRLYTQRSPGRLEMKEHSAQVDGAERAKREAEFKEGKLEGLVCTPTLELGVDIGPLLTVLLRNAPPTPANYVQRVGRAGRRLRIGFASTFCAGGAHDRHAFEHPEWLLAGKFTPPRLRLDNERVVYRHLRSFVLESIAAELPDQMGKLLDDGEMPTRWMPERLWPVFEEARARREELVGKLAGLFAPDRARGRTDRYQAEECGRVLDAFDTDFTAGVERWWRRVRQLDEEFRRFSRIGSPQRDERLAKARRRAFREITQDPERAYTLNYLAVQGLLPGYQFPLDTFSLDPGVLDTPTLHRAAAIAIEEFAPGNFVYANGHKLRSIRVLFAGPPAIGAGGAGAGRTDATSAGRLRTFQFCDRCDQAVEVVGKADNACRRCGAPLETRVGCVFVDAFEAEESLRIGADEESRQRRSFDRRDSLLATGQEECRLHDYPFLPAEVRKRSTLLITNWGQPEAKGDTGRMFLLCPECGRHCPHDRDFAGAEKLVKTWDNYHAKYCSGRPEKLVLGYELRADALIVAVPALATVPDMERQPRRRWVNGPLVTLAEALLAGATDLLELEPFELQAFAQRDAAEGPVGQIVFYETVPGGAGIVEEMGRRLPSVADAARERLYEHTCMRACYLCLKHYRNQGWHPHFDKESIRDILFTMSRLEPVGGKEIGAGEGIAGLAQQLDERRKGPWETARAPGTRGPQSPIEAELLEALRRVPDLPAPQSQYEVVDRKGNLRTVPDFAYPEEKIAIFCDGFAYHGNADTLELDARKRNWLQSKEGGGWSVLTYWGRQIRRDPEACALEVGRLYQERRKRRDSMHARDTENRSP